MRSAASALTVHTAFARTAFTFLLAFRLMGTSRFSFCLGNRPDTKITPWVTRQILCNLKKKKSFKITAWKSNFKINVPLSIMYIIWVCSPEYRCPKRPEASELPEVGINTWF